MHLLIPFANCTAVECHQALATLKLPNLERLLRQLPLAHTDTANESTLSPPHERALAAAYGITMPDSANTAWPDGQTPWGAWHAMQAGYMDSPVGNGIAPTADELAQARHTTAPANAWAVITPCHWTVQTSHITMTHPRALNLGGDESRALLAAMQPYFAEDGIALMYDTPTRWLARGGVFAGLATASPYRVVGAHVDDWLPKAASAKLLRRLQNEMQMLLYTHPLTDARTDQGLLAVNSFWVSGTGALPAQHPARAHTWDMPAPPVIAPTALRDAAVHDYWSTWAQAWQQLDATDCAALLKAFDDRALVTLTLCGERSSQTYRTSHRNALTRLAHRLMRQIGNRPTYNVLSSL